MTLLHDYYNAKKGTSTGPLDEPVGEISDADEEAYSADAWTALSTSTTRSSEGPYSDAFEAESDAGESGADKSDVAESGIAESDAAKSGRQVTERDAGESKLAELS